MKTPKEFIHTAHFLQRLEERGLSLENTKNVVIYHHKVERQYRGTHGGFVNLYTKTVDGKTLSVAAEVWKGKCWLLTAFHR